MAGFSAQPAADGGSNHPYAVWIGVIAFLNFNIAIGGLFGSFSVLLAPVEARLGVGRELSTLGIPAVSLMTAIVAPFCGALASRFSLKLLMTVGALLNVAGFLLLAFTDSLILYIAAYGLFMGPALAIGVVLPATLVTRWFTANRGKTLGLVHMPIVVAVTPLLAAATLASLGLVGTYLILAGIAAIPVVANLFIRDHPPETATEIVGDSTQAPAAPAEAPRSMGSLLASPRYWAIFIAAAASTTGSVILGTHIVPLAGTWGMTPLVGATLHSIMSLAGIAGTVLFGWLADRIGGVRALALLVFNSFVLWLLLLMQPGFATAAVLIGLIGVHGAGAVPVLTMALGQTFGQASFSRAYGLVNFLNLPLSVSCVPIASLVFNNTGSYHWAIVGQAVFFLGTALLASMASAGLRRPVPAAA